MPAVCRHRDICSGHGGYPPREVVTHSPNVFVNTRGVARVGDRMQFHTISTMEETHDAAIKSDGKKHTVFVNGKEVAYPNHGMTDAKTMGGSATSCASVMVSASRNVFFE